MSSVFLNGTSKPLTYIVHTKTRILFTFCNVSVKVFKLSTLQTRANCVGAFVFFVRNEAFGVLSPFSLNLYIYFLTFQNLNMIVLI